MNYDEKLMTCKIYSTRPNFCRVEESFGEFLGFENIQEYYRANEEVCKKLQAENDH